MAKTDSWKDNEITIGRESNLLDLLSWLLSTSILKTLITMTGLEIILIIMLWVITGLFLCSKRKWYIDQGADQMFICTMAVIFAPINLIITFFKVFLIDEWE